MIVRAFLALMVMLATPMVQAQGFAGLGEEVQGFAMPDPGYRMQFPRDHGAHPDFRIEWWYVTANLTDADGNAYGIQWTLFRSAIEPGGGEGWQSPQVWMGNAALTTRERHYAAQKFGRGDTGSAGVIASPFDAWIDDWQFTAPEGPEVGATLMAGGEGFSYALNLTARGGVVLQGDQGYSVKSANGQASHYYSMPFFEVTGQIVVDGRTVKVRGKAWMDREWSSQPLDSDQTGWDWFSLYFADGARMMAFQLRGDDDKGAFLSGTWIGPDGASNPIGPDAITLSPMESSDVAGRSIPTTWRLQYPEGGVDIITRPLNRQSWMDTLFPYWEGPITFDGSHAGQGYLEMTGYPAR